MSATPFLQEVLELVSQFLNKNGHKDLASKLQSRYQLPDWALGNNPIFKKGLAKIVKEYVKSHPKTLNYYQTRQQSNDTAQTPNQSVRQSVHSPRMNLRSDSPKVHNNGTKKQETVTKTWQSAKFDAPKSLQEIESRVQSKNKDQTQNTKKAVQKNIKKDAIESSDYESEEDSFQLQPKKKVKKDVKQTKKIEKQSKKQAKQTKVKEKLKQKEEEQSQQEEQKVTKKPTTIKQAVVEVKNNGFLNKQTQNSFKQQESKRSQPPRFFSRINADQVGPIRTELNDNSFQAKGKYGQAQDQWGQFGYNKLKDTRGESFKKTKGKLKNHAFQGMMLDFNKINSIPL